MCTVRAAGETVGRGWSRIARHALVIGALALAATLVGGPPVAQAAPKDPIIAARFVLTYDGVALGSFSELHGIATEVERREYMGSGDDLPMMGAFVGQVKPSPITLRRAMPDEADVFGAWHRAVRRARPDGARRTVMLKMQGTDGRAFATYRLKDAWPSKVEISGMKAGASEAVIQSVTIVAESIHRVS